MKKIYLILLVILLGATINAQSPESFNYQAVLRDDEGHVLTDQDVRIDIGILQGSTIGPEVFTETHMTTTNAFGLINLMIGSENPSGMESIDWSAGPYFIKIIVDSTEMVVSQLLSVPYALHTKTATNVDDADADPENELQNIEQVLLQGASAGNQNITNLADPVNKQDAATKEYVDALERKMTMMLNSIMAGGKVTDYDGNEYHTVKIGNQIWMAENLKTTHYADGSSLVDGTGVGDIEGDITTKYYFDYDDDSVNTIIYGKLYTWAAIMNDSVSSDSVPSGVQGICPLGWHVPSDSEWIVLTTYLGGEMGAGGKLKETGTDHWQDPNEGATNETGFTARGSGIRYADPSTLFKEFKFSAHFWSCTELGTYPAINRMIFAGVPDVIRSNWGKDHGLSVRCVKD